MKTRSKRISRRVLRIIFTALNNINRNYITLSDLCYLDQVVKINRDYTQELVFCYEFYYQIRKMFDKIKSRSIKNSSLKPIVIQGEVDKRYQNVPARPDFIIHSPGEFGGIAIIEVKRADRKIKEIINDLDKMQLIDKKVGGYQLRIEIIIGPSNSLVSKINDLIQKYFSKHRGNKILIIGYNLENGELTYYTKDKWIKSIVESLKNDMNINIEPIKNCSEASF